MIYAGMKDLLAKFIGWNLSMPRGEGAVKILKFTAPV